MAWASETISSAPDLRKQQIFHVDATLVSTAQVPYRFCKQQVGRGPSKSSAMNDDGNRTGDGREEYDTVRIEQQGYR